MDELTEEVPGDASELSDRWDGRPDLLAEDIFRVRNMNTGETEPLRLFRPYQPKMLHAYFYGDESIVNVYKGRRIGVSFIFMVGIAIDALTTPDANFAIVSRTKSQSQERLDDLEDLLRYSRLGIDPDDYLDKNNRSKKIFPNGASVRAFSGDPNSARGMDSAKVVFVDEQAFLEDQDATMNAFMPFINLGSHRKMLQVSTPRTSNDTFLTTHQKGTESGRDGVISIKQPSFKNPHEIDIERSLLEQEVEPVRPDMDVRTVETERAQDPQGFAQEYLCRPISDEYRFFTKSGIEQAMKRGGRNGYIHSPATHAREGGTMVMGVDIGIDRDDTAVAVFEHVGEHRYLRFHTILGRQDLNAVLPVQGRRTDDPSAVADYISAVTDNMGVDRVFLDKTGPGKGFQKEVEKRIGRKAVGFNFSDKDEIERMMGDFNYALHNDLLTLVPDTDIQAQLESVVKEQRYETSKPRFSGKEHAPDGKDDLAMALVLGAYPPRFDSNRATEPKQETNVSGHEDTEDVTPGLSAKTGGAGTGTARTAPPSPSFKWGKIGGEENSSSSEPTILDVDDSRIETDYEPRHSR